MNSKKITLLSTSSLLMLLLFSSHFVFSQEKNEIKKDTTEKHKISLRDSITGAIDISDLIYNARGFMPIPMIVTEPAVGYGGGLAILYLLP
ncbi:MAG TPA: hypothetical protein VIN10_11155, partial [Bacteroidales bacterium]